MEFMPSGILAKIDVATEMLGMPTNPVTAGRVWALGRVRDFLGSSGLLECSRHYRDLSLIPFIYQELNYDGYSLSDRCGELGYLTEIVEIDFALWSGGKRRANVTDECYQEYVRDVLSIL